MATSGATVIGAAAAKARREVREHFDRNNAFDPSHAVPYDPPSHMHRGQFESLIGRGVVLGTGDGRYWLDREADRAEEERRQASAVLLLKIILIGIALATAGVAIVRAMH